MSGVLTEFKYATKNYLSGLDIGSLRSYGRNVGVFNPTTKKKAELIEDIVSILAGEMSPVPRSNLGAPVKSAYVDPNIEEEIAKLQMAYLSQVETTENNDYDPSLDFVAKMKEFQARPKNELRLEDPNAAEIEAYQKNRVLRRGQLETLNGVSVLLPLNCRNDGEKIIVSVALIKKHDLREGDIISCYAIKHNASWIATEVLAINDLIHDSISRFRFDEEEACYSSRRLRMYEKGHFTSTSVKYLDWLIPLAFGQRGCVFAAPKAGKTSLLLNIAQSAAPLNEGLKTLALLIDQPPETVSQFRAITESENLVYTTYDDEPERQIFAAEFILKRAKRLTECGYHVLLIVDSLTALAKAYNETDASSGGKVLVGGLESKTLQYIKKYFGTARCFGRKGSLTMIGSVDTETGNPVDDIISAELAKLSNVDLCLNAEAAAKRIYPAFNLSATTVKQADQLQSEEEIELDFVVRNNFLPKYGLQELNQALSQAIDFGGFKKQIFSSISKK